MGPVGQAGLRPLLHTLNYKGWLLFFSGLFYEGFVWSSGSVRLVAHGVPFLRQEMQPSHSGAYSWVSSCSWSGFAESKLISILRIF